MTEDDRIALAAACRDADSIPKVPEAGAVVDEGGRRVQIMHNGMRVLADAYYGPWMTRLITALRGHHEPQEELVFHRALAALEDEGRTAPVMVELGGYWCYYSLWFKSAFPAGRAIVVEPIEERLAVGRLNFELNARSAEFVTAAVDAVAAPPAPFRTGAETAQVPRISLDALRGAAGVDAIDILHIDVQGWERRALLGARDTLAQGLVGWVFASTHRWLEEGRDLDLHQATLDLLTSAGYVIVAAHTPEESFTVDGLVVARHPDRHGPEAVPVSTRRG
ncbi:FkbM family methyltransferase [Salinarimonas sp.]|uniref:FkbM family methyltransferase n=1 Tax=Salinarimonas sp. TaxID=2766526 RepID=UPI0032D8EF05